MAYTTIDNPELYFQTKLYTGNATDDTAITLDGSENMQPDWIWTKERSQTGNHNLFDSVRGVSKRLRTETTDAEGTLDPVNQIKSFDSDGFTLGTNNGSNENSVTFVAWCWKAGTSFSNDASATSVGTIDSSGSASDTAGFSIVSYTGTGSNGTVKHGLSTAPKMIWIKNRNLTGGDSQDWSIYNKSIGAGNFLYISRDNASAAKAERFNSTDPTSTVFSLGTHGSGNGSSNTHIAYCFAEKQGYSKIGSFNGNGNADGPFVYCGFLPAWVIIKKTNSSGSVSWFIFDNKRSPINAVDDFLKADTTDGEGGDGNGYLDFLSNGFKFKTANIGTESGGTFIFMAFAEAPFVNSNGIPNNAR